MDRVPRRLAAWWRTLDDPGRRHATLLALVSLGYLAHYLVYCWPQPFFIEDAGISFAYARNLVDGEGLVTYPGGERVEGYSNALWTFLMALLYALGIPLWTGAKVAGAVFGLLTLPLAYLLVKQARPGAQDDVALLAPVMLAASPQFVVWNSSGLENSLFCVLLAGATWRLVAEMQAERDGGRAGFPWSALLYVLLCMTRPEGLMYAGIGLFGRVLGAIAVRRPLPVLAWLAVFAVPFGLYNAWRYWYFAWPFPNTYYAKLGKGTTFKPWSWSGGGWKYVKNWFMQHSVVYMLPLLGLAMTGLRRRRRALTVLLLVAVTVVLLWDGRAGIQEFEPDWWMPIRRKWVHVRVWTLAAACALLGLATLNTPGWRARGLLWTNACAGVFFALYSGGDWMKAHRWFNLVSVSLFPVLAIGLGELLDLLPGMAARLRLPRGPWLLQRGLSVRVLLVLLAGGYWVAQETWHTNEFANNPETSVRDVHRRVKYMTWVQRQLDLDEVTLLDVDMGAHMYFTDWAIADIAGLVDVPMAHHRRYPREFVQQYIFEERNPDFAHVHGGWARSSKIPTHTEWKERYLELPGYPIGGRKLHVGNHVRKDLFITDTGEGPPDSAQRFGDEVHLVHLAVPSPEVAAGELLFVDTTWQAGFRDAFEVLLFLDDGAGGRTVQAVEPGYGWYPPEDWGSTEQVAGRFRVALPEGLAEGSYRLGVVVIDQRSGEVLPHAGTVREARSAEDAAEALEGEVDSGPESERGGELYLPGEWLTEIEVQVVPAERAYAEAEADAAAALDLAQGDDCDATWPRFKDATRHVLADLDWRSAHEEGVREALAACLVRRAAGTGDEAERIELLVEARGWDRHQDDLVLAARSLAAVLSERGHAAREAADWELAYASYRDALRLDPRLSWIRRHAETARDHALGLVEEERPEPPVVPASPARPAKEALEGAGPADRPLIRKRLDGEGAQVGKAKGKAKAKGKGGRHVDKGYIDGRGTKNPPGRDGAAEPPPGPPTPPI